MANEKSAAQPHEFVGRLDRWCEVCHRPDRDPIHKCPHGVSLGIYCRECDYDEAMAVDADGDE